jgi:phosphoglycolate phosphatase
MKYNLVIFDLDGTLLDTTEGILLAIKQTILDCNLQMLADDDLKTFIGPPIEYSFSKFYNLSGEALDMMSSRFRELYSQKYLYYASPYIGIFETLSILRNNGVKTAVATYKRETYAVPLLKYFHFDKYFDFMYGSDAHGILKKKDIIRKCILSAGILNDKKVLMVGDTIHDADGASSEGLDFLAVSYGFGFQSESELANSSNIGCAKTASEIVNYLI